jgi:hypothetical protein
MCRIRHKRKCSALQNPLQYTKEKIANGGLQNEPYREKPYERKGTP